MAQTRNGKTPVIDIGLRADLTTHNFHWNVTGPMTARMLRSLLED